MKFECRGISLATVVGQVAKARSKNQSQSFLQDIFLSLDDHQLTVRATNLEITCEKSVAVKGIQNGSCILKGDTLVKILPTIQKEDVVLNCELVDGTLAIASKNEIIEIKTTPYEDFPTLPNQGENIGNISLQTIITLLKEVSFCSATTEIKPEIASVYFYTKDGNIISVATDSYRLAEKVMTNESGIDLSILIPQKHIVDIVNILSEEKGEVSLYKKDGLLTISVNNLNMCINLITGQFPDYRQLYPKEFNTVCSLNKEDLQKSLNLTTYFTEQYSQVKCSFTNNVLKLHSKNESIGQVTNSLITKKEGDDIEANYNNRYFLDVFSHLSGQNITLSFTSSQRAMFIKSKEDTSFTYLLMPLNR